MDFTRAQQADFHPSICCVNNHGKRGCWNNSNILFKTFPSCYNANLMTLGVMPGELIFFQKIKTKVPCCVNMAGSEALKKLKTGIDLWQDRYLAGTSF